jgi:hypothetical protein
MEEKDEFILTKIKALINQGANIEIYDFSYTTNSLFEMALAAKNEKVKLKIHIRKSEFVDLQRILEGGGKYVTFIFD